MPASKRTPAGERVDSTGPAGRTAETLLAKALEAVTRGDEDRAWSLYQGAEAAVAELPGAGAIRARALAGLAGIARGRGEIRAATELLERAEAALTLAPRADPLATVDVLVAASEVRPTRAAIGCARAAVVAARAVGDENARVAARLRAVRATGNAFRASGRYRIADRILDRAARAAARHHGDDSLEVAGILNDLGVVRKFAGRFDEARTCYTRVEAILAAAGLLESADGATLFHNLGGLLHAEGRFAEAEVPARRGLEIRLNVAGPDHHTADLDRIALASILDHLDLRAEAEELLQLTLPRLRERLGPDSEVAVALTNLGALVQRDGRYDEAERLYREALAIRERELGPRSPSLAGTLNNLGTVLRRAGRPDEARAVFERALAVLGRSVGPEHPTRRTIEINLERLDHPGRAGGPTQVSAE